MIKHPIILLSLAVLLMAGLAQAQPPDSPEAVVQAQLDAYNQRDLTAFLATFSEDVTFLELDGRITLQGKKAVAERFGAYFEASPNLHSHLANRIIMGNKVFDHEQITGANGSKDVLELVMIYEVKDGKIYKATAVRKA